MVLDYIVIITLWLSIIIYAALGGADFGGGVWDFIAHLSKRKDEQELITSSIGPVWEANNVWLIYLVVGLYTAFPTVSYTLAIALYIPLTLALVGVVMRGAAFAFRSHFQGTAQLRVTWGLLFNLASLLTPFFLGVTAAAVASGKIRVRNGQVPVALVGIWLSPFAIIVGLLAIALCTALAAVYLAAQAQRYEREKLADIFRMRAFIAGGVTAVLGIVGIALMPSQAPILWSGLFSRTYAIWAVGVTILLGLATAAALYFKKRILARILVDLDVAAMLGSWGLAQVPYIVPPDLTVANAASPPATMKDFMLSAILGLLILLPSLWFLFHVFEGQNPVPPVHEKEVEGV